jgi:hypothetical protein
MTGVFTHQHNARLPLGVHDHYIGVILCGCGVWHGLSLILGCLSDRIIVNKIVKIVTKPAPVGIKMNKKEAV